MSAQLLLEFSVAAEIDHCEYSGSKQQAFILSQVWRSEVQNASWGSKTKVLAGPGSFQGLRQSPLPDLFQLLEDITFLDS